MTPLTPAELDVLRRVALGATTRQIAADRGCASQTVKNQRHIALVKLGIADTVHLVHYLIATGMVALLYRADGELVETKEAA